MSNGERVVRVLLAMLIASGFVLYAMVMAVLAVPMLIAACMQYLVQLTETAPVPVPVPGLRLKPLIN